MDRSRSIASWKIRLFLFAYSLLKKDYEMIFKKKNWKKLEKIRNRLKFSWTVT